MAKSKTTTRTRPASGPIMVLEVGPDGRGAAPRPMKADEHRTIAEEIVLGLLDAGIDVGERKDSAGA